MAPRIYQTCAARIGLHRTAMQRERAVARQTTMRIGVVAILLFLVGCAQDVRVRYPSRPEEPTSSVVLLLGDPASGVSVAVNGFLVVEDEHTSRVTIDRVPIGNNEIVMSANGADKSFKVWVTDDHATTVPMGVPDGGGAVGFLKTIVASIITICVYSIIH
jgi:anti-sigma-K factor RskA